MVAMRLRRRRRLGAPNRLTSSTSISPLYIAHHVIFYVFRCCMLLDHAVAVVRDPSEFGLSFLSSKIIYLRGE